MHKVSDLMILKKDGVKDIDHLHIIVLFKADFNHNNKILGRTVMYHTVLNNILTAELYSMLRGNAKCNDHEING